MAGNARKSALLDTWRSCWPAKRHSVATRARLGNGRGSPLGRAHAPAQGCRCNRSVPVRHACAALVAGPGNSEGAAVVEKMKEKRDLSVPAKAWAEMSKGEK